MPSLRPRNPVKSVIKRVTTDITNATNVNADVTGISFDVAPNDVWSYEINLQTGCDNTGGLNVAMSIPAGAAHRTVVIGIAGSSSSQVSSVLTSSSSSSNMNTVNSANGWVRITGVVANGATAGTVQLKFKSGTDTQTSTVFANSSMNARKIA